MPNSWIDRRLRKRTGSWSPIIVVAVGSMIVVVGQLGATIFPIIFGPDLSDYNLLCDPIYHEIKPPSEALTNVTIYEWKNNSSIRSIVNTTQYEINISKKNYEPSYFESKVYLLNAHPIHSYTRQVFLTLTSPPWLRANLSSPIVTINQPVTLNMWVNYTSLIYNTPEEKLHNNHGGKRTE